MLSLLMLLYKDLKTEKKIQDMTRERFCMNQLPDLILQINMR
jgi:hypothetical protein